MDELSERIREAAKAVGGLDQLASDSGVARRTLGHWLKGRQPKPAALERIASASGVSLHWLVTGEGHKFETDFSRTLRGLDEQLLAEKGSMSTEEFEAAFTKGLQLLNSDHELHSHPPSLSVPASHLALPRYDIHASAGRGALVVSSHVEEYMVVGRDWLRRNLPPWAPPNAVVGVLEGSGDSMEPTIRDGDLIMVVQDIDLRVVERGGIFVLSLDRDRLLLKRLQLMANGDLTIISDNKNYAPETIARDQLDERVIIHGQVFFVGGKPRAL